MSKKQFWLPLKTAHERIIFPKVSEWKGKKVRRRKIARSSYKRKLRRNEQKDEKGKGKGKSSNLFQYQFSNYTFIHHTCKTNKSLHSVQINFSFSPSDVYWWGTETNIKKTQVQASSSNSHPLSLQERNFPPSKRKAEENLLPFSLSIWLRLHFMLDFDFGGFE